MILVAEDEIINFLYLEALFERYPFKILHARNGKEAVTMIEENKTNSLVLMDIKMPIMNGDIALQKILEYENNNIGFDWQYPQEDGGGIKCKNYELCEAVLPKWWFECKGNYLCTNCHMMFGTWKFKGQEYKTGKGILDISDNIECPVCLEVKRSISQPNCEHTLCIECCKRCYYA